MLATTASRASLSTPVHQRHANAVKDSPPARQYLQQAFLSAMTSHTTHLRLAAAVLLLLPIFAGAQLANRPPSPSWLIYDHTGHLEQRFEHTGPLLMAILFVAADSGATIHLNGHHVSNADGSERAQSLDVTKHIRSGVNVLRISGGTRAAALLELNGDLNRKSWIVSDASWSGAKSASAIDLDAPDQPFDFKQTFDAYNSWQLAKPGAQTQATDAASITVPSGFKVELVRSALPQEGSWVAMAFDESGRITLAMEKKGLLRLSISASGEQKMEVIEDSLLECRGLLYAHGSLFANANNTKALFRLDDTDKDGTYETKKELLRTEGGVGHGRNHIKLGPDGAIYVAHGNNVHLPANVSPDSPLKHYADDQLIPNPWDASMFDGDVILPAGHVLRVTPDGSEVQVIAGGLRNPLDIAFHQDGALFTFDADMERDVGTHFYMPTRVLHIVPGADYGWRRGTSRWPDWYVDTLPSVVDIGLSSPTATFFGYGAAFPKAYQDALFICDWSYGRLIAVHLQKTGESYTGRQETFATGRPLNLTDGAIGPDGALWFTTGGRGTQSGLYRISYIGAPQPDAPKPPRARQATPDRFALQRKRMVMEESRAFSGKGGWDAINAMLAAVRAGSAADRSVAFQAAMMLLEEDAVDMKLAALRIMEIAIARGHAVTPMQADALVNTLGILFPARDARFSRELCKFLVHLKSPVIIKQATRHLAALTTSEDLVYYPFILRYLKEGWTVEQRRIVFDALNRAEKLNGASTYFKIISDTRSELAAALKPDEARALADVVHPLKPTPLLPTALPGHSFKQWKLADLEPHLPQVLSGRSFETAKSAMVTAQCFFCHKVSNDPALPAGLFGPELVQVRSRFSTRDLLLHILEPSLVIDEKFRYTTIKRKDGQTFTGLLDSEDDERVVLKPNPLAPDVIEIGKSMIQERTISDISPMPAGLLNALKREQILDLLAWFEVSGDPKGKVWK